MSTNDADSALSPAQASSLLREVATAMRGANRPADAEHFERIATGLDETTNDEHRTARLEKYKSELAKWEAEVKYGLDWKIESFRATLTLAQRGISAAMLINGGAAVALWS